MVFPPSGSYVAGEGPELCSGWRGSGGEVFQWASTRLFAEEQDIPRDDEEHCHEEREHRGLGESTAAQEPGGEVGGNDPSNTTKARGCTRTKAAERGWIEFWCKGVDDPPSAEIEKREEAAPENEDWGSTGVAEQPGGQRRTEEIGDERGLASPAIDEVRSRKVARDLCERGDEDVGEAAGNSKAAFDEERGEPSEDAIVGEDDAEPQDPEHQSPAQELAAPEQTELLQERGTLWNWCRGDGGRSDAGSALELAQNGKRLLVTSHNVEVPR